MMRGHHFDFDAPMRVYLFWEAFGMDEHFGKLLAGFVSGDIIENQPKHRPLARVTAWLQIRNLGGITSHCSIVAAA